MSSITDPLTIPFDGEAFERALEHFIKHDDGAEAKRLLAAGIPIYYIEDDTPSELLIKEYPDGKRELIRVVGNDEEIVKIL